MNGKRKMLTAVVSVCAVLAVSTVIASSHVSDTPLFMYRMEQASSKMNFLPTAVNEFVYTAENGVTLGYNNPGNSGIPLEVTVGKTCEGTCIEPTCPHTCPNTCAGNPTCSSTCPDTCGATCDTCDSTCDTCDSTCIGNTCADTCPLTCETCEFPCTWIVICGP